MASTGQAIPSIGVLILIAILLGEFGFKVAVLALVLYAFLPVMSNTMVGIQQVDRAVVIGPSRLHASHVESPDIRAGMALLIAALGAEGSSHIYNVGQIERGWDGLVAVIRTGVLLFGLGFGVGTITRPALNTVLQRPRASVGVGSGDGDSVGATVGVGSAGTSVSAQAPVVVRASRTKRALKAPTARRRAETRRSE